MLADGWDRKPGVHVVFGRWQDVIDSLGPFDGVFFDTYGEDDMDMRAFHEHLPRLLKPGGVYSFFNGMCPDNLFFSAVSGKRMELELAALGLRTRYELVSMPVPEGEWDGVKRKYWHHDKYFLPVCVMDGHSEELEVGGAEGSSR